MTQEERHNFLQQLQFQVLLEPTFTLPATANTSPTHEVVGADSKRILIQTVNVLNILIRLDVCVFR